MGHPGHVQSRRRVAVCGRRPTEQATQTGTRSQGQRNHDALNAEVRAMEAKPIRETALTIRRSVTTGLRVTGADRPVAVDGITARAAVAPARWVDGDWRNLGEAGRFAGDGEGAANQERPLRCTAVQLIDSRNSMASCDARTPSAMSTTGQIT